MNIICNNCVGGRIYQLLGTPFNHPLVWCRIYYANFKKLIQNIKDIDYTKYRFVNKYGTSQIIIGDDIELNFTHYRYDASYDTPTKVGNLDIMSKDIEKYAIEKYTTRLKRFNLNDDFCFILTDLDNLKLKDEEIVDFLNIDTKYQKLCITNRNINSNKTPIIHTAETNTAKLAKLVIESNLMKLK